MINQTTNHTDLYITSQDAEEFHNYKYEDKEYKKIPRSWFRFEYF